MYKAKIVCIIFLSLKIQNKQQGESELMKFNKFSKILLSASLAAILAVSANAEFSKTATYSDGQFTDVKNDAWYTAEVKNAYELGFMNGTSETLFSPDGNVTVAQGITMAARINALNKGEAAPQNSKTGNWYDNAVKYAIDNGIIAEGDFDSYTRNIKRHEMATLIYDSMPVDAFAAKNKVYSIPDVSNASDYIDKLLALYNAGIVMGNDAYGSFLPENDIRRSETAAIINRVAIPENRLSKVLELPKSNQAYLLCANSDYNSLKEGISSGWVFDNRGGPELDTISTNYGPLTDISTEFGTAMIREFNPIDSGEIVTETSYTVKENGLFLEFRDRDDKTVYQIKLIDNAWQILGKDGKYTVIKNDALDGDSAKIFKIRFIVNLDNGTSTTYIDDVNCGTHELLSDNIINFRYATDEKSVLGVNPGAINMYVNYKVYDYFEIIDAKDVYGWTLTGKTTSRNDLYIYENSSAVKTFEDTTGVVTAQTNFLLPLGGNATMSLLSGDKAGVTFEAKDGKFYAGGKELYTYTKNMWYRLRINANTTTGKADILLNGRSIGVVDLATTDAINGFSVTAGAASQINLDYLTIFENVDHLIADYVPEPTTKANLDDYIVGLNICSLWKNGDHYGWACISPYEEPKPVLGYYDETLPETADWEIKYMVEHGIDFQAFCWFSDIATTPVKNPGVEHLHDGFMYSRYSDYMKYTLIWEIANGARFHQDAFRTHVIPYWFENYFLDDRYLKIDNKIILLAFGAEMLYGEQYFGSIEKAKAELDYLDEVAKSYGFDGVVILSSGADPAKVAQIGIEGAYAYNWGTLGSTVAANKSGNLNSAKNSGIYTVPTISTGFDSIPWHGKRYPNMTVEDFATSQEWVKNEYLPEYATPGTWNEKLVMISTWNEYGEGTYIMPSGLNGFGYLDVLRDAYTNLDAEHADPVPTGVQSRRINHLYPQYARILRDEGWYKDGEIADSNLDSMFKLVFDLENSKYGNMMNELLAVVDDGIYCKSKSDNNDPLIHAAKALDVDITGATHLKVTMKAPKGSRAEVFFTTASNTSWSQKNSFGFDIDSDEMKTYTIKIQNPAFTGTLKNVRLDPVSTTDTEFTIHSYEILKLKDELIHTLYINDKEFTGDVPGTMLSDGTLVFPFDPATGMAYALNFHHTYRRSAGTLTIEGNHHKAEFLIGSSKYTFDGVQKDLGYVLYKEDGLPMLPLEKLMKDFGYTTTTGMGDLYITTPKKTSSLSTEPDPEGTFNFNGYETQGWTSSHMALFVSGGTMTATSLSDTHYDPVLRMGDNISFDTKKFTDVEIRCRYKYQSKSGKPNRIVFYFLTNKDSNWNEEKTIRLPMSSMDSNGEWETIKVNLRDNPEWINIVTQLRLDPFDAVGTMEFDYIKFIEDPDYVYVDPADLPFEIVNGDAENTGKVAFYSDSNNSSITIVQDPTNPENHVYNVLAKEGKKWTYFCQTASFKAGKTYKISFDAMLTGANDGSDPQKASMICNLIYPDSGANGGRNHLIKQVEITKDKWVHVETYYTVEKVDSPNNHEFTVYTNPTGENGMHYMMDNVAVEEVDPATVEAAPSGGDSLAFGENTGILEGRTPVSDNAYISYSKKEGAYIVEAKSGKQWTYFTVPVPLEAGRTYWVTFEAKITGDNTGNTTNGSSGLQLNFQYPDNSGSRNHVLGYNPLNVGDDWKRIEAVYVVGEVTGTPTVFSMYVNPIGEAGPNYMIRNLIVAAL